MSFDALKTTLMKGLPRLREITSVVEKKCFGKPYYILFRVNISVSIYACNHQDQMVM